MPFATLFRQRNLPHLRQVLSGQTFRRRHYFFRCSTRDDMAAVDTGAGAKVDKIVRRADSFFVVFHNNYGIAEVTKPPQSLEQPSVVPGM